MVDEIFDRTYQQGRANLNAGIERALDGIGTQWRKLNNIQWRAPWNARRASQSVDASCA